jgi:hypothetical protein
MTFINAAEDKLVKADAKVDKLGRARFSRRPSRASRARVRRDSLIDKLAHAEFRRLLALSEEPEAPQPLLLISSPGGHVESGDARFSLT